MINISLLIGSLIVLVFGFGYLLSKSEMTGAEEMQPIRVEEDDEF